MTKFYLKDISVKNSIIIILFIGFILLNAEYSCAQNYWGEGSVQPLDQNPNPEVLLDNTNQINKPIQSEPVKPSPTVTKSVSSSSESPTIELSTSSEKIPSGTKLSIVMKTNLNAKKSKEGDPFSAIIKEDVIVDNNLILPAGSLMRGRVDKVKKPGIFSKSGSILLNFDHIVTPLGKQVNLDIDLSKANNINKEGAIIANKGFSEAIKESARSGYETTKSITKAGYDAGMAAGKVPVVVTTPVAAAAGTLTGTTVFATKSTIAIFKKGGNPIINPGDTLEINFSDELDVPVN